MNRNSANFDELTQHWSSGDNVYGSGCQINATTPRTIFDIAFSNESTKFFNELIKNEAASSNSNEPQYTISPWIDAMAPNSRFSTIKQRKVTMRETESGIAFFLRKNITTNITQTAFFDQESVIIYSVAQSKTESKESDHIIIDRWTIKNMQCAENENEGQKVSVMINVNVIWKTYQSPTATIIKSKWLRFYQSRFEKWRCLIKEYVERHNVKSETMLLMEPYLGIWNKLNSLHTIRICVDQIEYSDGSRFNVSIDRNTREIIAVYANSRFTGKLIESNNNGKHQRIEWNNGSIWIKNGFSRFAGEYIHNSTQQKYIIDKLGTIKLPITGKKCRFKLVEHDRISYAFNGDIAYKGTLDHDQNIIKWDNGTIWKNTAKPKRISISKHCDVSMSKQNEEILKIEKDEISDDKKMEEIGDSNGQKTVEFEGEVEEDDFEHFEHYGTSLEIKNYEHFVLVNDDELFGTEQNENNDQVDEWMLV